MKKFTLYWRDGKRQVVTGETIVQAMTRAGYGGGAVGALDFYANGDDHNYQWRPATREWVVTAEPPKHSSASHYS